jgi:lysophospholipase L1-like esterase
MQTLSNSRLKDNISSSLPLKIIAIGDSLIYGYGDKEAGGWVERLRLHLMNSESGHIIYNLGIRGDRTEQVNQRLNNEFNLRGEIRNKYPDLILMSIGINDTPRLGHPQGRNLTNFQHYTQQINDLLDNAQKLAPVIFIGMIPVDESKMPFMDCLYFNLRDQYHYKEIAKQACQNRKIEYLDIFDLWMSRGDNWYKAQISHDGLHPNSKGYSHLYQEIMNWQGCDRIFKS